jgi:hypothetical protein
MQEKLENLKVGQPKPSNSMEEKPENSTQDQSETPMEVDLEDSSKKSPINCRSTTPNSASTYEYSHEPFLSFQHRIVELAGQRGAVAITNVTRLRGGESNRVISATLGVSNVSAPQVRGVFRIPRFTIFEDDEKAAIEPYEVDRRPHKHVALSGLPAVHEVRSPAILAFDATAANAIHSPYTFQKFGEGTRLDDLYEKTSLDEKLNIVDEVVSLQVRLESIKFREAGRIRHSTEPKSILPDRLALHDQRSSAKAATEVEVGGLGVGICEPRDPPRAARLLPDILIEQLESWTTYETESANGQSAFCTDRFKCLQTFLHEMETLGFSSLRDFIGGCESISEYLVSSRLRTRKHPCYHKHWRWPDRQPAEMESKLGPRLG